MIRFVGIHITAAAAVTKVRFLAGIAQLFGTLVGGPLVAELSIRFYIRRPLSVPTNPFRPIQTVHVQNIGRRKVRSQQVRMQLLGQVRVDAIKLEARRRHGVGNGPKMLRHGLVFAVQPQSLRVEFGNDAGHRLVVEGAFAGSRVGE